LVNGIIFHSDQDHKDTVKFLRGSEEWLYLFLIVNEIIYPVMRTCVWLIKWIRLEGYLGEADFPSTETRNQPDVVSGDVTDQDAEVHSFEKPNS
jgi:hypothetical protein